MVVLDRVGVGVPAVLSASVARASVARASVVLGRDVAVEHLEGPDRLEVVARERPTEHVAHLHVPVRVDQSPPARTIGVVPADEHDTLTVVREPSDEVVAARTSGTTRGIGQRADRRVRRGADGGQGDAGGDPDPRRHASQGLPTGVLRRGHVRMCGYRHSVGAAPCSLIDRVDNHRNRFCDDPALSFVPDARAPPNGCWPTIEPVGLSLT